MSQHEEQGKNGFVRGVNRFITVIAVSLSLFQLYTAGFGALTALRQRSFHLAMILVLVFALYPPLKSVKKDRLNLACVIDFFLVALSFGIGAYIFFGLEDIFLRQGDWNQTDMVVSVIAILLVLEACRRVIGYIMTASD